MSNSENAVADFLADNLAGYSLGSNLFIGPMRDPSAFIPEQAIFVVNYSGDSPIRVFQKFNRINVDLVQVMIRAQRYDYENGKMLADSLWNQLDRAEILDEDGYIAYAILCEQSAPIYLGQDTNGFSSWTINLQVKDLRNMNGEYMPQPVSISVLLPLLLENGVISIPQAGPGQDGYLSADDWTLFASGAGRDTFAQRFALDGLNADGQYLWMEGIPSNHRPLIMPYDAYLLGFSGQASAEFTATVYKNGSVEEVITVTGGQAESYTLANELDDGDEISVRVDGEVDHPSIQLFFGRR